MTRFSRGFRLGVLTLVGLSAVALSSARAADPNVRFRDLAAKFFEDGNGQDIAKLVGFTSPVKKVIALEYKVLLYRNGKETIVDPKSFQFKIGDSIRLTVEPFSDSYVYIFHIGASGQSGFLLPQPNQQPPMVKARQKASLPGNGYFEFVAPPGDEKLLVVAADKPVEDRKMLANVLTKPAEQYTAEEQAVSKTLNATVAADLKSVQERETEKRDKVVKFRGLGTPEEIAALAEDVRTRAVGRGTVEEPPRSDKEGTCAMYVSVADEGPGNLLVTIPLKSK